MSKIIGCDFFVKTVLVGDPGVGKTSLMNRIISDAFQMEYLPTIAVDLQSKSINVLDKTIKLDVWDTAGQEKFRSMCSIHYKGADIIILIFDLNNKKTFESIINDWLDEVAIYSDARKTKILIWGNKSDIGMSKVDVREINERLEGLDRCKLINAKNVKMDKDSDGYSFLNYSQTNKPLKRDDLDDETFVYSYESVSAKNGFGVWRSLESTLEQIVEDKKRRKSMAKKERDFGSTKLVINENDFSNRVNDKKCC